jgi:hypothetical protein
MPAAHIDALVARLLQGSGHVLTTSQLRGAGLTDKDVHRLTTAGTLHRLRRGALVDGTVWRASAPWERHRMRARALAASLLPPGQDRLAMSHHSALSLFGHATHGVDDAVHMCRVGSGKSYRTTGLHVHGPVGRDHIRQLDGILVVSPALACLQVAATFGAEAGLVSLDSALRSRACSSTDLSPLLDLPALRTGRRSARAAVALADGRRESAGESRSAWLLQQMPVPRAIPQALIRDPAGAVVARVDFLLDGTMVVVEFDGMLKYTGITDIHAEKRREDALRDLGYEIVRLTWDDLNRPEQVLRKILAALDRAHRRVAS